METTTDDRVRRPRDRGSFRVLPLEAENEQQLYAVVAPTGVTLYTFTDVREATAEASALNSARIPDRVSSWPVVRDAE
jgi:hypothetical protein